MDDGTGRCSRILIATFYLSLFGLLTGCSNKLSHKNTEDSTISQNVLIDTADSAKLNSAFVYDTSKRYVYLTLDDGPQPGTMNCYHTLKNLDVKASFFMVGLHASEKHETSRKDSILKSYPQFVVCNHSYTHANYNHYKSFYEHPDSAYRDVVKAQTALGSPVKIVRMPGNSSWVDAAEVKACKLTKPLCLKLDSAGYKVAGWDIEWRFKNTKAGGTIPVQSATKFIEQVEYAINNDANFTKRNIVILAHDRMFASEQYTDSLAKVITTLKADPRIVFETIDHYPTFLQK